MMQPARGRRGTAVRCVSSSVLAGVLLSIVSVFMPFNSVATDAGSPIVVTTLLDVVNPRDGVTSLREALDMVVSDSVPDTIQLAADGLYEPTFNCLPQDDLNAGGDFDVRSTDPLTITGVSDAHRALISRPFACPNQRIFHLMTTASFTLRYVDLYDGQAQNATVADSSGARGGGILSGTSSITLDHVTMSGHHAGAAGAASSGVTAGGSGGGIYTQGNLTIVDSSFGGNWAGDGYLAAANSSDSNGGSGGAIYVDCAACTVSIDGSTFTTNGAGDGGNAVAGGGGVAGTGGAIYARVAHFTLSDSLVRMNYAGDAGDARTTGARGGGDGGAIDVDARTVDITGTTFESNIAGAGADGPQSVGAGGRGGALAVSGVGGAVAASIVDCVFSLNVGGRGGNSSAASGTRTAAIGGDGGAIVVSSANVSLSLSDSTINNNAAGAGGSFTGTGGTITAGDGGSGGGVAVFGASLAVDGSIVKENSAGAPGVSSSYLLVASKGNGGGIFAADLAAAPSSLAVSASHFVGNIGFKGGAIATTSALAAPVAVSGSSFANNLGYTEGGLRSRGGALWLSGNAAAIAGSGFFQNAVDGVYGSGGAVSIAGGSASIRNSTLGWNTGPIDSAIESYSGAVVTVGGSLFAPPYMLPVAVCSASGITSIGYNAALDAADCPALVDATDLLGVEWVAAVGTYGDNGPVGGAFTMLPRTTGPLFNAIPSGNPLCAGASDQRGLTRPTGSGCEIGSTETLTTIAATADSAATVNGATVLIDVLANDTVVSANSSFAPAQMKITEVYSGGHGTIAVVGGKLRFTATTPGVDSIAYVVCNVVETTVCAVGTATITVTWGQMFAPTTPTRLADTRPGKPGDLWWIPRTRLVPFVGREFPVVLSDAVPDAGVEAVALNVTVTGATESGYVTIYPCGDVPNTSNITFPAGRAVANSVVVSLSWTGSICAVASRAVDLVIDMTGWFPAGAGFVALSPNRMIDTRVGTHAIADPYYSKVKVDRTVRRFTLGYLVTVPDPRITRLSAVAVNVTVVGATSGGYLTIYPCGRQPAVSSVNFAAGSAVSNAMILPVDSDRMFCMFASTPVDVIVDFNGWIDASARFTPAEPTRLVDTRAAESSELSVNKVKLSMTPRSFVLVDSAIVPDTGVAAVALTVTAVGAAAGGYVTVYPCGSVPTVSTLNVSAGRATGNSVIVPLSAGGAVCAIASTPVDLILDVQGWFTRPPT